MKEKAMMILAIAVFTCVPMVQLVSADNTPDQGIPAFAIQSLRNGLNLEELKDRFSMPSLPDIQFRRLTEQKMPDWSTLRKNTTFSPRVLPTPSNQVFPTPAPTQTPDAGSGATQSPVYVSDLNCIDEYVKITNSGSSRVIMTGWKISNRQGKSITFIDYPLGGGSYYTFTLLPKSTVTVHSGMEGNPSSLHLYWPEEMWNDAGDTAYLYNPEGVLVSTLSR